MKSKAFTLIELLLVIAVIALLAALLLPTLARSKALAQRTYCLNNMKEIALATATYANDSKDYLPFPNYLEFDVLGPGWLYTYPSMSQPSNVVTGLLWPLVKNQASYWCPRDTPPYLMAGGAPRPDQASSYCMNAVVNGDGSLGYNTLRMSCFRGEATMFWESDENSGVGAWNDGCNNPPDGLTSRHLGGGIMTGFDGHGNWMKQTRFNIEAQKTPGLLWCNPLSTNGV